MTEPRYVREHDGYIVLMIEVADRTARLHPLQLKRTLVDLGYVFLGSEFEPIMPILTLDADKATGRGRLELHGFTREPRVVAATRRFLEVIDSGKIDEYTDAGKL